MNTYRIHIVLTSALAGGLSVALAMLTGAGDAVGYPAGASVSMGTNPIATYAGFMNQGTTETITTAPSDQEFIITDIVLGITDVNYDCRSRMRIRLFTAGGSLGEFALGTSSDSRTYGNPEGQLVAPLQTGMRLGAGDTLEVSTDRRYSSNCSSTGPQLSYTLSGYYAAP